MYSLPQTLSGSLLNWLHRFTDSQVWGSKPSAHVCTLPSILLACFSSYSNVADRVIHYLQTDESCMALLQALLTIYPVPWRPSPLSPVTALVQSIAHCPWSPFHAGSCLPFVELLPCTKPSAWQISYLMSQEQILQGVGLPVPILHGIELSPVGYEVCWRSHG